MEGLGKKKTDAKLDPRGHFKTIFIFLKRRALCTWFRETLKFKT